MEMNRRILKRDGRMESWSTARIAAAIFKAFEASGMKDMMLADRLARKVEMLVFEDGKLIAEQEFVQNKVESILMRSGFEDIARRYIIYREQRRAARDINMDFMLDSKDIIEAYQDQSDWRVNENANMGHSLSGLILHMQGEMQKKYALNKVYPKEIRDAHTNGYFHIHDLSFGLTGYCFTGDTKIRLADGTTATLVELAENCIASDKFSVYSKNIDGNTTIGTAYHPRLTRTNTEIFAVELSCGITEKCTPDHQFMLISGDYKEAQHLDAGDILMTDTADSVISVIKKPYYIGVSDVYCITVEEHENFALASGIFVHNCAGWSLRDLLLEGFNKEDSCAAGPASHLSSALGQVVNFLGTLQNEWAGAQAFNNFDTYLAPFIRQGKLSYSEVKQLVQSFVHSMNTTSRWGSQSPFTNITLDVVCPKHIANEPVIISGKYQDTTYGEYQEEMTMINKAFIEVMLAGDYHGRTFSFPIPTYNVTKDFDWDGEVGNLLLQMTVKYGTPYFQNFINSDLKPEDVRSMCPLHPDEKVYVQKDGDDGCIYKQSMQQYWDEKDEHIYKVFDRGTWYPATMTKIESVRCIKITLENGASITMDERHEQPIKSIVTGDIHTLTAQEIFESLYTTMQLPYQSTKLNDVVEWKKIVSIEEIDYSGDVYCFVVNSLDHLFLTCSGIITHNCRLQMDIRELRNKTGGLFGAGDLTGSIGVVTLNLSKLAYLAQDENDFMELITEYADMAKNSLEIKRKYIQIRLDMNQMPWTKRYLKNGYKGHFSTIGVVAGHEACMNLIGKGIDSPEGTALMQRVLHHLRKLTSGYQKETGNFYNLESSPAEGVSYRLAKLDRDLYGTGIYISGNNEIPYYTNSTNLPVGHTDMIFDALEHQNKLQTLYTGGTVFHSFFGESMPDTESVKNFLLKAMAMTKIPYISITPTFSVCHDHGYIPGEQYKCPTCDKDTEVFSRVVGYYRPVNRWNKGKKQEWQERKEYNTHIPGIIVTSTDINLNVKTEHGPHITNIVAGELV